MDALERLSNSLGRLPGVGRRSAERMALKLVLDHEGLLRELVVALEDAERDLRCCSLCGSITSVSKDPCRLCTSPARDAAILCVVEEPSDILLIERSGGFHGRYHALMGKLSPMKGDGINDLRLRALQRRVKEEGFKEVLLALGTDVEGDSTSAFIGEMLKGLGAKISRIAFGLPAGSGIMYTDPLTLAKAIEGRRDL
jgi:recombination protein RecR